ncbi:hypothetical protein LL912_02180 [Niabella sp. CC-SYL272]|uniref:hypothetical protein n=1 Tax=Niabella agricola TaxID=2891571 RepID=UPI001F45933E|nr:hypothetical protein [Niabella agricola]MCF3107577.1 hypothetical protein [Niabella agricola]
MKTVISSILLIPVLLCSCIKKDAAITDMTSTRPAAQQQISATLKAFKTPPLAQYITTVTWRGARVWYTPTAAWVDSVRSINFYANGTVEWVKQGWEYVTRLPGTYVIQSNAITIRFRYPPYTHQLRGTYDRNTGLISGTFTETRDPAPDAPPAYAPGTTTGEFNFYKQ